MFKVLFVCTGNTCRSPMAQMLLGDRLEREKISDRITAMSAGMHAFPGGQMSLNAQKALLKHHIRFEGFASTQIDGVLVEEADIILAMGRGHLHEIKKLFPKAGGKVFVLGEFAGKDQDVCDPFCGDESVYEECFKQIAIFVDEAFPRIKSIMEEKER